MVRPVAVAIGARTNPSRHTRRVMERSAFRRHGEERGIPRITRLSQIDQTVVYMRKLDRASLPARPEERDTTEEAHEETAGYGLICEGRSVRGSIARSRQSLFGLFKLFPLRHLCSPIDLEPCPLANPAIRMFQESPCIFGLLSERFGLLLVSPPGFT